MPPLVIADAGVPMIALEMPVMFFALVPIILIEAYVIRRRLNLRFRISSIASAAANVVSTIIGIPVAWGAMLALHLLTTGGYAKGIQTLSQKIVAVTLQAAWLIPYRSEGYWMIPTAAIVLLVPNYLISVWLERLVARRILRDTDRTRVDATVRLANIVSYSGLLILCLALLAYGFLAKPHVT
jgi:hypothetical protein